MLNAMSFELNQAEPHRLMRKALQIEWFVQFEHQRLAALQQWHTTQRRQYGDYAVAARTPYCTAQKGGCYVHSKLLQCEATGLAC
eukprot:13898-Heterococcus_DN1.PRE.1